MRRSVSLFLALLVLAANTVWAMDYSELASVHSDDSSYGLSLNDISSDSCDHCCHGAAHFLGILPTMAVGTSDIHSVYPIAPCAVTVSRFYQPPTPPPNV